MIEAALAPVLRAVGGRLADLTDLLASKLLELDAAASELAAFVERIATEHGHAEVMRLLFEHNLVLDGTFLALMRPLLAERADREAALASLDPAVISRARETLTRMLVALARLDAGEGDVAEPGIAPLDELEDLGFADEFPLVFAWLEGRCTPEDDAHFVFTSYLTFLQTFVMRAAMRNIARFDPLAADAAPRSVPRQPATEPTDG